jgi:hypothetical protein
MFLDSGTVLLTIRASDSSLASCCYWNWRCPLGCWLWDEVGASAGGYGKAHVAGEWLAEATEIVGCENGCWLPIYSRCMGNNTKQYEELASVDFVVLRPQLYPSISILWLGRFLLCAPYPLHRISKIVFLVESWTFLRSYVALYLLGLVV